MHRFHFPNDSISGLPTALISCLSSITCFKIVPLSFVSGGSRQFRNLIQVDANPFLWLLWGRPDFCLFVAFLFLFFRFFLRTASYLSLFLRRILCTCLTYLPAVSGACSAGACSVGHGAESIAVGWPEGRDVLCRSVLTFLHNQWPWGHFVSPPV